MSLEQQIAETEALLVKLREAQARECLGRTVIETMHACGFEFSKPAANQVMAVNSISDRLETNMLLAALKFERSKTPAIKKMISTLDAILPPNFIVADIAKILSDAMVKLAPSPLSSPAPETKIEIETKVEPVPKVEAKIETRIKPVPKIETKPEVAMARTYLKNTWGYNTEKLLRMKDEDVLREYQKSLVLLKTKPDDDDEATLPELETETEPKAKKHRAEVWYAYLKDDEAHKNVHTMSLLVANRGTYATETKMLHLPSFSADVYVELFEQLKFPCKIKKDDTIPASSLFAYAFNKNYQGADPTCCLCAHQISHGTYVTELAPPREGLKVRQKYHAACGAAIIASGCTNSCPCRRLHPNNTAGCYKRD